MCSIIWVPTMDGEQAFDTNHIQFAWVIQENWYMKMWANSTMVSIHSMPINLLILVRLSTTIQIESPQWHGTYSSHIHLICTHTWELYMTPKPSCKFVIVMFLFSKQNILPLVFHSNSNLQNIFSQPIFWKTMAKETNLWTPK